MPDLTRKQVAPPPDDWEDVSAAPTPQDVGRVVSASQSPRQVAAPPPGWEDASAPSVPPAQRPGKDPGSVFIRENLPRSAKNFYGGLLNTVIHPIDTGRALGALPLGMVQATTRKYAPNAAPAPAGSPMATAEQAAVLFGNNIKDRYGSWDAIKRTAYEDPVGTAADASAVLGTTGSGLRLIGQIPKLEAVGAVGRGLETVASYVNPIPALPFKGAASERMYQSALKPPKLKPTRDIAAQRKAVVRTGLKEGIPVSPGGLEVVRDRIGGLNSEIADVIAKGGAAGTTIDPAQVALRVDDLKKLYGNQVNPMSDLAAIEASKQEFLTAHTPAVPPGTPPPPPTPISLGKAQEIKQNTYNINRKKYGELRDAQSEAQKALARGLKEEIANAYPEIRTLNTRESALIDLEKALEAYVARHGNRDLIGMGTPIFGSAAGTVTGNPTVAGVAMLAKSALEMPAIKSRLAIALNRAARRPGGELFRKGATRTTAIVDNTRPQQ